MSDYNSDFEALYDELIHYSIPFKALTGGADVYTDYSQSVSIGKIAHRNGFHIQDVTPLPNNFPFGTKVVIRKKNMVRSLSDKQEETHRNTSPRMEEKE